MLILNKMMSIGKVFFFSVLLLGLIFFVSQSVRSEQIKEIKVGMISSGALVGKNRENFLNKLHKYNIPYFIDEDDQVHHWAKDTVRYLGVKRKVLYGDKLRSNAWESVGANGRSARTFFEKKFKEFDIRYDVREVESVTPYWTLHYNQLDGPQVDQIRQEWELLKLEQRLNSQKI